MQQGLLARISRSSVLEYHAFGIISYISLLKFTGCFLTSRKFSEGKDSKEHYLICGVQGDFTKGLVDNPPTHLWTRQLKVCFGCLLLKLFIHHIHRCPSVCWSFQHIDIIQTRNPSLYRHRARSCFIDMFTGRIFMFFAILAFSNQTHRALIGGFQLRSGIIPHGRDNPWDIEWLTVGFPTGTLFGLAPIKKRPLGQRYQDSYIEIWPLIELLCGIPGKEVGISSNYFNNVPRIFMVCFRGTSWCHETYKRSLWRMEGRSSVYHFQSARKSGNDGRL